MQPAAQRRRSFSDRAQLLRALLVAGRVRRPVAQGSRLGRASRSNDALTPLVNMGQQLFEPPDVNGWDLGPGWFSSGAMLARMNFAAQLATQPEVQPARLRARPRPRRPKSLRVVHPGSAVAAGVRGRLLPRARRLRARRRQLDRIGHAARDQGVGPGPPDRRLGRVSVRVMRMPDGAAARPPAATIRGGECDAVSDVSSSVAASRRSRSASPRRRFCRISRARRGDPAAIWWCCI